MLKNILVLSFLITSCMSRAPSDFELDKRAGLVPQVEPTLRLAKGSEKLPTKPNRSAPWFERVWVYDQEIDGGYWMQGTYIFLEVEPSRWLNAEEASR